MAGRERSTLDLSGLERELLSAFEQDVLYWQQNDAKLRAINQRVPTYAEFRDMVKAAHLKPVKKKDSSEEQSSSSAKGDCCSGSGNTCCQSCSDDLGASNGKGTGSATVWNPLSANKRFYSQLDEMENDVYAQSATQPADLGLATTSISDFMQLWRSLDGDAERRLEALQRLGTVPFGHLFASSEIPVGLLGEILEAALHFRPNNKQDICFVVRLLFRLSRTKRFYLTLEFLSSAEKAMCSQLLAKLNRSLVGQQQDLAERGVTEWTLRELQTLYRV